MILNQPVNRLISKHGGVKMAWYDFTMGRFWHRFAWLVRWPSPARFASRLAGDLQIPLFSPYFIFMFSVFESAWTDSSLQLSRLQLKYIYIYMYIHLWMLCQNTPQQERFTTSLPHRRCKGLGQSCRSWHRSPRKHIRLGYHPESRLFHSLSRPSNSQGDAGTVRLIRMCVDLLPFIRIVLTGAVISVLT